MAIGAFRISDPFGASSFDYFIGNYRDGPAGKSEDKAVSETRLHRLATWLFGFIVLTTNVDQQLLPIRPLLIRKAKLPAGTRKWNQAHTHQQKPGQTTRFDPRTHNRLTLR
jgi:hypothetical protein